MRKKRLLIIVLSILIPSIVVASILIHQGQEPSDGGVAEVPADTTPSPSDTSTPEPTVPPSTPSTLTMLSITEGNVFVMKAGTDSWIEAQVGMSIEPGDIVKSGDSSSAEITFFDGSTIELQAGTEIEVASLDISTDTGSTTISLKQAIGDTVSRVTKLVDPASSYEVETPAGVAAVRGSVMLVSVIEDGTTWITNKGGNMRAIAQGVELDIPEWRQCIIIPGQPPRLISLGGSSGGGGGSERIVTDLALDKSDSFDPVDPGTNLIYTLQITNNGPSDSTGAVVLDALPSGVSFVSATDGGTYDPGSHTVSWAIGALANDASTSVNITVTVNESITADIITNTATVDANERDRYPANDTATEDTTIDVNDPPLAEDDIAITDEDNSVTVAASGVLNNDSDPDVSDTLTVTAVDTSGTVGIVTDWDTDGSFTYDPNGQFEYLQTGGSTNDSFTYTVSDGNGGTDNATVIIAINGVNDVPTDISLDNSSVAENQPSGTVVGDFSTTDPDTGDTFIYSLVSGEGDDDNASFTITGSQLQTVASFNYETKNSCSIRIRTTDSGILYYEEAFIITVINANDPPVAVDDSDTTPADTPVTIDVLDNDSDVDGDTLTIDSVTQGTNGSVTNNGNDVTYTPDPYFDGTDSFTYTISDGNGGTDTATVIVTVLKTLTRINIQIDTGPKASIFIWDDTTGGWAIDEDTQELIDGTNHVTSDTITVAGGHYYYVWVEATGVIHYVKNYPKDWTVIDAPEGDREAAYGYAAADSLYSVHFTMK
jgi:uncharacterized repeat protein (TIGR01451 family)